MESWRWKDVDRFDAYMVPSGMTLLQNVVAIISSMPTVLEPSGMTLLQPPPQTIEQGLLYWNHLE